MGSKKATGTMMLDGEEYVIVPRSEYLRLTGGELPEVDAIAFMREEIGRTLKAARDHAGLSQAELAEKVGKSQSAVAGFEAGRIKASDEYVRAVLKACKLPMSWKAPAK